MENELFFKDSSGALEVAVIETLGNRERQEDNFFYQLDGRRGLFCVCDGMGGHDAGDAASSHAISRIKEFYNSEMFDYYPTELMIDMMKDIDDEIYIEKDSSGNGLNAGTTNITVYIRNKKLYWASVGDCRGYVLRNGKLVQFSYDHTYGNYLEKLAEKGQVSNDAYSQQQNRKDALISYLGIGGLEMIDYNDEPLTIYTGDTVLLISDGVYKLLSNQQLKEILENNASVSDSVKEIERIAAYNSKASQKKRDNLTAMIVKIY